MSRGGELLAAFAGAQAGGFLAQPPGLDGEPGLGIPGVSGVARSRTWDVVASARSPGLVGDTVVFVVLADGTAVLEDDQPDDSLAPLAEAIEELLPPPYRAAAVRNEGDFWSAAAEAVVIVELPHIDGNTIDLSVVGGVRELTIDDEPVTQPVPALDLVTETHADVVVHAERVDGDVFAVDVFQL